MPVIVVRTLEIVCSNLPRISSNLSRIANELKRIADEAFCANQLSINKDLERKENDDDKTTID